MFEVRPLTLDHVWTLVQEPMNEDLVSWYEAGNAKALTENSQGFSVFYDDALMVVAGICPLWTKRGYLWSVFSEKVKDNSVSVYKGLRYILNEQQMFDRIEMDVPLELEIAHRRAKFLGFELECPLAKRFSPKGEPRALYAWVREQ